MNMLVETLVVLGISLEIFGAMECQGSLVVKIEKKQLLVFCTVLAAGQALALGIGDVLSLLLSRHGAQAKESFLGQVIAAAIFLLLGLRLLLKAWKNERIVERREEKFQVKKFLLIYSKGILFTFLAGIALGFLGGSVSVLLLLTLFSTILVTVVGMYTGYRLGFEHKMKAYILGGLLLIAGSVEVIARFV